MTGHELWNTLNWSHWKFRFIHAWYSSPPAPQPPLCNPPAPNNPALHVTQLPHLLTHLSIFKGWDCGHWDYVVTNSSRLAYSRRDSKFNFPGVHHEPKPELVVACSLPLGLTPIWAALRAHHVVTMCTQAIRTWIYCVTELGAPNQTNRLHLVIDSHNATIQLVGALTDETVDLKILGTDETIEFTTIAVIIFTTDIIIIIIINSSYSMSCSTISSYWILGVLVKLICGILMGLCTPQGLWIMNKPRETNSVETAARWLSRKSFALWSLCDYFCLFLQNKTWPN